MRAVIFDVDGTVVNVDHRLHHLSNPDLDRNQQWNAFFADIPNDTPIEPIVWLNQMLRFANGHRDNIINDKRAAILVVSARPETYKQDTIDQLKEHGVFYDALYMRGENDTRADQIVKAEILQKIIDDGYEPFLAVDDRPQVVKMWREFGITCLQCAPDEPLRSKYAGQALLTMLVGPAGAGKSTLAEKLYDKRAVVSTDAIREEYGWGHSPDDLKRTWEYTRAQLRARLECGLAAVLDATNIKRKDRLNILSIVPKGQLVNYVVIDRSLDDKLKDRGWRPEELVLKHHRTFQANLRDILDGDQQDNVIVYDKRSAGSSRP